MSKMSALIVLLLSFAPALNQHSSTGQKFVLWNVGQGQWATWVQQRSCYHFDMGGEWMDWPRLKKLCAHKQNQVFFTHADADHINMHRQALRYVPNLCVQQKPLAKAYKIKLPICIEPWPKALQVYRPPWPAARDQLPAAPRHRAHSSAASRANSNATKLRSPSLNDLSMVFVLRQRILLPGDSSRRMEKQWAPELFLAHVHTLVLGHHGSLSSTGEPLLRALPNLRQAVASARRQKYGHPHPRVLGRLWHKRVPLLSTHEWGHIWLHL